MCLNRYFYGNTKTWFEPVTQDKYPNMSRLIESWKKSGWEYYFYDDDTAGEFLSTHFPPEVREAYESIIPGEWTAFMILNEKMLVLHVVANNCS